MKGMDATGSQTLVSLWLHGINPGCFQKILEVSGSLHIRSGPGALHFHKLPTCSHHWLDWMAAEPQSLLVLEGSLYPRWSELPHLPTPGLAGLSGFTLFIYLFVLLGCRNLGHVSSLPALFSLPLPSLKGQVRPSLSQSCPFMALLFQNVAKFINSPFLETESSLYSVQCGGRAGS